MVDGMPIRPQPISTKRTSGIVQLFGFDYQRRTVDSTYSENPRISGFSKIWLRLVVPPNDRWVAKEVDYLGFVRKNLLRYFFVNKRTTA